MSWERKPQDSVLFTRWLGEKNERTYKVFMINMLISGGLITATSLADSVLHEGRQTDKIPRGPIITVDIHPA